MNTNIESNNTKQGSPVSLDILNSPSTQIFFYSHLLTGSSEIETNPFLFGQLDKDNTIKQDTPTYHFSPKDEENNLGTLLIFLNASTLTLLNYSLLDSSLNIKLECNSKESKAILEREQIQREQIQRDSNSIDSLTSTAMLHPILEDDETKCPHNGVVKLKSNKGKLFTSKGIPLVLESDLLHSSIIGCTNNIAGVPTPCTSVSVILPSARGLKKFNDDYPIMQDLVSSGVMSDKGFLLICTPKENTFRINSPNPSSATTQNKESLASSILFSKPILRLHYKIHSYQKDNLPICRIKRNDTLIQSHNDTPLDSLSIDITKDTKELSDTSSLDTTLQNILSSIHTRLKDTYIKGYKYHYLSLQLDSNALILILLIPQKIPKVFKEVYKNYEYKDYGIGKYHYLYNYCTHTMLDIQDYTQIGLDHNPSNATILTLHTPYKAQRLEIKLAYGLDSIIESKDRQRQAKQAKENKRHSTDITSSHTQSKQKDSTHSTLKQTDTNNTQSQTIESKNNTNSKTTQNQYQNNTEQQIIDSLLTLQVINGGYEEKHWGFREETENKDTQANPVQTNINTESKDSKATQENKEKQILEMYFSYGDDMARLQGDSRHTQDVNLHIKTQGYEDGEEVEVRLESSLDKVFSVSGIIQDNQIMITNPFKEQ